MTQPNTADDLSKAARGCISHSVAISWPKPVVSKYGSIDHEMALWENMLHARRHLSAMKLTAALCCDFRMDLVAEGRL